jgi:hypothetical protein
MMHNCRIWRCHRGMFRRARNSQDLDDLLSASAEFGVSWSLCATRRPACAANGSSGLATWTRRCACCGRLARRVPLGSSPAGWPIPGDLSLRCLPPALPAVPGGGGRRVLSGLARPCSCSCRRPRLRGTRATVNALPRPATGPVCLLYDRMGRDVPGVRVRGTGSAQMWRRYWWPGGWVGRSVPRAGHRLH